MLRPILVITAFVGFIISIRCDCTYLGGFIFLLVFGICQQEEKFKVDGGIENIDKMDGITFEAFTVELFKSLGYSAKVTQAAGDFGADVIAKKGKDKIAIQCKRYSNHVGVEAIYQVLGGAKYYGCNKTIVVTNNYYTEAAKKLSRKTDTLLIDRDQLKKMIKDSASKKLLTRYSIR